MSAGLLSVIDAFARLRVAVIGEAMLDVYLDGDSRRLCQEAPVPVVDIARRTEAPGGAANVAANLRALGADVVFLSVAGDDTGGHALRASLEGRGIDTSGLVLEHDRRTLTKSRVTSAGQMVVRYDQGDTGSISSDAERAFMSRLTAVYPHCDAVIISDYAYGVLTERVRDTVRALQRITPRMLAVDARDLAHYRDAGVTVVKPNAAEALRLLGLPQPSGARASIVMEHGERLRAATGAEIAAVTLDSEGAIILERNCPPHRTYALPRLRHRTAGAGDTYLSALALALAVGAHTPAAAEIAALAAAVAVDQDGTAACTAEDLREQLAGSGKVVTGATRLAARVERYRRAGLRIVFTNGCFDILHRGHITYLNRARLLGDVLMVGLNTDDSVRRLKGPTRPINSIEDRARVLAALSCVDDVVPFDQDTPVDLIRMIRPDVFAKGGDYRMEMLPEAPVVAALGGQVCILPYEDARSTSGIIERIRMASPAAQRG